MGQAVAPVLQAVGVNCLRAETPDEALDAVNAALAMVFQADRRSRCCSPRSYSAPSAFEEANDVIVRKRQIGLGCTDLRTRPARGAAGTHWPA
jgi:hypothetical protein